MTTQIRVFLAGIIQGSIRETEIHDQSYRVRVRRIIEQTVPNADVYCPIENHPNSLEYTDDRGREVFYGHIAQAAEAEVIVAFLPEASMGTAIEMWEARRAGKIVLAISPLEANWVVKFLPDRVFATIEDFEAFARSGELKEMLDRRVLQR